MSETLGLAGSLADVRYVEAAFRTRTPSAPSLVARATAG
jgi:hypothetical protein